MTAAVVLDRLRRLRDRLFPKSSVKCGACGLSVDDCECSDKATVEALGAPGADR